MRDKSYDSKNGEVIKLGGDHICTNLKKHEQPFFGTKEVVENHKTICWTPDEIRLEAIHNPKPMV